MNERLVEQRQLRHPYRLCSFTHACWMNLLAASLMVWLIVNQPAAAVKTSPAVPAITISAVMAPAARPHHETDSLRSVAASAAANAVTVDPMTVQSDMFYSEGFPVAATTGTALSKTGTASTAQSDPVNQTLPQAGTMQPAMPPLITGRPDHKPAPLVSDQDTNLWPHKPVQVVTHALAGMDEPPLQISSFSLILQPLPLSPPPVARTTAPINRPVPLRINAYAQRRLLQAKAAMQRGDLSNAESHLIAVQRLAPDWWQVYAELGQLALLRSQPDSARQYWLRARLLAPDPATQRMIARLLSRVSEPATPPRTRQALTLASGQAGS